jgi:hypothetical protein
MNKSLTIAWREFIEIVRTRVFLITSVLLPAGIVGLVLATEPIIESLQNEKVEVRKIAILDHTGIIATGMIERAEAYNERNPNRPLEFIDQSETSVDDLRQAVLDGEYYAYMELPHGVLDGSSAGNLGRKDNQISVQRAIRDHLNETLRIARGDLAEPKIPYQTVLQIMQPVGLQSIDLTTGESKGGSQMASFMMPFAFMFLLFMGTMGISQHLLTSLIEEKNTRVIEVLLSAVSPLQLMAGKIAGISAVGMLLLGDLGLPGLLHRSLAGHGLPGRNPRPGACRDLFPAHFPALRRNARRNRLDLQHAQRCPEHDHPTDDHDHHSDDDVVPDLGESQFDVQHRSQLCADHLILRDDSAADVDTRDTPLAGAGHPTPALGTGHLYHLGRGQGLPNRHSDVRQATEPA